MREKKPVKWDALKVYEALNMIEEYAKQGIQPLEQVRLVAQEARNTENLPEHIDIALLKIIGEIDRIIGGSQWEPVGRLMSGIHTVRDSIDERMIDNEEKCSEAMNRGVS